MKLQLKRSLRLSNGSAQAPSADQMGFGELAINYSQEDPTIFLKDSSNVVRKLRLSLLPDASNSTVQAGTLDERYLKLDGGTLSGALNGPEFVGGVARVSANAPASGDESELWFNSANGRLYIRYSDQWVDASPDSFTMGSDFYSKTQADTEIANAVSALSDGAVASNTSAITALTNGAVASNTASTAANTASIAQEVTDRTTAVSSEATARQAAIAAETAARQSAISTEATARQDADALKLDKTGGTISGSLTVTGSVVNSTAPSADTHLTNKAYVDSKAAANAAAIETLTNGAPELLNTLNELAEAIGDDENFATTVTNQITAESSARLAADTQLQANINAAVAALADGDVADANSNLAALASGEVATNAANIATNASGISSNASAISANTANISANASAISTNASGITANSNAITALTDGQVATNAAAIAALGTGSVADVTSTATANANAITALQSDVAAATTARAGLSSSISTNTSAIAANSTGIDNLTDYVNSLNTARSNDISALANGAVADNTAAITALTNGAPAVLNTLNELAAAIGDDANFSTTITNQISSVQSSVTALTNGAVATNTANISSNASAISTNATAISNNASAISSNDSDISSLQTGLANEVSARTSLAGTVSTNSSDIDSLQSGASTASSERTSLQNSINSLNTSVSTLQSDLNSESSTRLAAVADKMDIAGGTFTGPVEFAAGITARGNSSTAGEITLNCEFNSHGIKLRGPSHSNNASYTLTLPGNTGSSGQFLMTNGSGVTSWGSAITSLAGYDTSAQVDAKINALINGAPGALNTLNELAAALGDDSNFASTMTTALAAKANTSSLATVATTGSYNSLSNRPTIPTVYNASITLRSYGQNSNASSTFELNQSSSETITLPQIRYSDLSGTPNLSSSVPGFANNVSSSAPGSPVTGEFWTDTSSDPPVLKAYNGTAWIEVGSAGASGVAPVLNGLTLADSGGGARFTSNNFTGTASMLTEGAPVSQKGIKATVTGNLRLPVSTSGLSSNSVSTASTSSTTYTESEYPRTSGSSTQYYSAAPSYESTNGAGYFLFGTLYDNATLTFIKNFSSPAPNFGAGERVDIISNSYFGNPTRTYLNYRIAKMGDIYFTEGAGSHSQQRMDGFMWHEKVSTEAGVYYDNDGIPSGYFQGSMSLCSDGVAIYKLREGTQNYSMKLQVSQHDWSEKAPEEFTRSNVKSSFITAIDNFHASDGTVGGNQYTSMGYDVNTNRVVVGMREYVDNTAWEHHVCAFPVNSHMHPGSGSRINTAGKIHHGNNGPQYGGTMHTTPNGLYMVYNTELYKYEENGFVLKSNNQYGNISYPYFDPDGSIYATKKGADNNNSAKMLSIVSHNDGVNWQNHGPEVIKPSSNNLYTGAMRAFGQEVHVGRHQAINAYGQALVRTLLTQNATVSDASSLSTFGDYEPICKASDPSNTNFWGYITNINYSAGTFSIRTSSAFAPGDVIQSKNQFQLGSNTVYLVVNSIGEVTGHQAADPGFVQQGPGTTHQLKFPATFDSGREPDTDFPAGATLRMEIEASNSSASDTFLSNTITPT